MRDATKFAARCEQWHVWNDYLFLDSGPSKDCLYLNVYAPASAMQTSRLPVMVWIHGGGFIAGAGSEPRYTNSALVSKGVILVTLNYRLGVFGFLASEDLARENRGHAGNVSRRARSRYLRGRTPGTVPSIIGWNRDERAGTLSKEMTAAKWKAYAAEHYGERADEFLAAFPANSDERAVRSADDFTTDAFIALGGWRWAQAQSKTGQSPANRL